MRGDLRTAFSTLSVLQEGLVGLWQLREAGCTRDEANVAVRQGDLERYRRGVLSLPGYPDSKRREQLAALLVLRDGFLSHWGAAGDHGYPRVEGGGVEVLLRRARAGRLKGIRTHVDPDLPDCDVETVRGMRRTTLARTLCDISPGLTGKALVRAVDHVERTDRIHGLEQVQACVDRLGSKRRPVLDALVDVLETRVPRSAGDCDRTAEVLRWIAGAGIRPPAQQRGVTWCGDDYFCDLLWLPEGTNVEVDDDWSHLTKGGSYRDARRDAQAKHHSVDVIRVKPDTTEDELLAELDRSLHRHERSTG